MDVNESLPKDFEWYKHQIAGHHPSVVRNGLRQIGIIKEINSPFILKLLQDGERGVREVDLYTKVNEAVEKDKKEKCSEVESFYKQLKEFLPLYFGLRSLVLGHKENYFLQLEDVSMLFEKPCIMDIKIGRVSYEPTASPEKKRNEDAKFPYQSTFGFRINGYSISSDDIIESVMKDRLWGRTLTPQTMRNGLLEYFAPACFESSTRVLDMFVSRLEHILAWFEQQTILHFYSSSLLLVYEGSAKLEPKADVRMIDFSHALPVSSPGNSDSNYIFGLRILIQTLKSLKYDLEYCSRGGCTTSSNTKPPTVLLVDTGPHTESL